MSFISLITLYNTGQFLRPHMPLGAVPTSTNYIVSMEMQTGRVQGRNRLSDNLGSPTLGAGNKLLRINESSLC